MTQSEQQIMTMISSSGDAKAKALEALAKVKDGDYEGARALLREAKEADVAAHNVQTAMITAELNKPDSDQGSLTLLEAHAQDHYMTAQLARDLVEELVDVFEAIDQRKE